MAIDFHAQGNRYSYATRQASDDWPAAVLELTDPRGRRVVDVGCGGGIYAAAWARLGAASVIGIDFSEQMLTAARERNSSANVTFRQGEAASMGLPDGGADIVFSRAMIHHLDELDGCFAEMHRILAVGGLCIIQERTPADVDLPGTAEHVRGYLFERFPRLLDVERGRRPTSEAVATAMQRTGFAVPEIRTVWEARQVHPDGVALADDLRRRTGRSILHELDDAELGEAIAYIDARVPQGRPIVEKDRWTLWSARRP